ncbi:MAG: hypothetical protein KME13_11470 [Myxacorys californica WJT36-NPBG1]|jgi:hypothetical protein|nr:hypothetical protein [Myxacorys californica WJT36-NPBG1]
MIATTIAKPFTQVNDERSSSRITATCAQCRFYSKGICKTKAEAGWENEACVKPTKTACHFAQLLPF